MRLGALRADIRDQHYGPSALAGFLFGLALLAGCMAPIGATRSPARETYAQLGDNALSSGEPSADTTALIHRHELDRLFAERPDEAVRQMHLKAAETGERDLLFALAEMSYLAGERIRRTVKPWDARDARDYYLGTAVYAYLYLFGERDSSRPTAFDRRFRMACDLYNFGLGLALAQPKDTNAVVQLRGGKRRLPVGEIDIQLDLRSFPWPLEDFQSFVLGDQYKVHGLSVRNRQPGLGVSLIAVPARSVGAGLRTATATSAFLRFDGSLKRMSAGSAAGMLELYSAFGDGLIRIGDEVVPLETDWSVPMAYALNQSLAWKIERLQFLSLQEMIPADVYLSQPYQKGRIPVVFVHGTMSSPVRWAEMLNSLRTDPELRQRYQFWYFIYNSSAPVLVSAAKLREAIQARIKELDPSGGDPALQQMVVIGHSQGGLVTKLIATETGDQLWRTVSSEPVDDLELTAPHKEELRQLFFLKPLPCVRRVVFISTPHRGSYRAAGLVQQLARRVVSIPASLGGRVKDATILASQLKLPNWVDKRKITSIDGMSPKNPTLRALAEMPVGPGITVHSIIAVRGTGDYHEGGDGVVKYDSAHLDHVESELIIRSGHSCQSTPAAIEEVRRILHAHLEAQKPDPGRTVTGVALEGSAP